MIARSRITPEKGERTRGACSDDRAQRGCLRQDVSAVYPDDDAGVVLSLVRGEKDIGGSDVRGSCKPPQWNPLADCDEFLRGTSSLEARRVDRSGCDGIHGDSVLGQLNGRAAHETLEAGLRGGIGREAGNHDGRAGDGCREDDPPAAAPLHQRHAFACQPEWRGHIHRDDVVPLFRGQGLEVLNGINARTAREDVDSSVPSTRRLNQALDRCLGGQIGGAKERGKPLCAQFVLQQAPERFLYVGQHDRRTAPRKLQRDASAAPLRRACDDRYSVLQCLVHEVSKAPRGCARVLPPRSQLPSDATKCICACGSRKVQIWSCTGLFARSAASGFSLELEVFEAVDESSGYGSELFCTKCRRQFNNAVIPVYLLVDDIPEGDSDRGSR